MVTLHFFVKRTREKIVMQSHFDITGKQVRTKGQNISPVLLIVVNRNYNYDYCCGGPILYPEQKNQELPV